MQINTLQRVTPNRDGKYIGRGGSRGKTSGRGTKGQLARSGRKLRPELRDIIKKIPKKRGYRFKSRFDKFTVVNLSALDTHYNAGEVATKERMLAKGLIRRMHGVLPTVKILAKGTITKKITVTGCHVSTVAKAAIEKAGGTVE